MKRNKYMGSRDQRRETFVLILRNIKCKKGGGQILLADAGN